MVSMRLKRIGRGSWCLRGGAVLDLAFGTRYAGDIDVFYEGRRPSDEQVRQLARRPDLSVDAKQTVFPRTRNDYILSGYAWTRVTNFDDLKLHRDGSFSLDGYGCERANLPKRLELVLMPAEVPETESVSRALARV